MVRHALRTIIALVLLASALGKTIDLPAFTEIIGTYQALPEWAWRPAALASVALDWVIGLWLMLGTALRGGALLAALLQGAYAGLAALTLWSGIVVANTGTFGIFFPRPLAWSIVVENCALAVLALLLAAITQKPPAVEGAYQPPFGAPPDDE